MSNSFIEAFKARRTQYALGKNLPISQDETAALIKEAVRLSPSAFNSQSSRVVILFGAHHDKFWGFVKSALQKIVPADQFAPTEERLKGFRAGAGTALFYEDQTVVAKLQKDFAAYADNFPIWSEHSTGIAQVAAWTALANANIGASLQHYNPLPDADAAKEWGISPDWKLRAQLVFGSNEGPIGTKEFIDDSTRFKVFG